MSIPDYDFLEQEAPEEAAPETATEPVASVEPVAPATPAAPTAAEPEGTHVPLAALKAEREKRQAYERELAQYRQQAQQPAPELPQFFEAPEQYVQQVVNQATTKQTQVFYVALEEAAREQYADYDEIFAEVCEAAQGNPLISQQVFSAPNPAVAAYKLGQNLRAMKELQDPAAYRQKVEAEVRAQIKAEQDAAAAAKAAQVAAIPPDLSAARSARDEPAVEDDSLDSILASKKR